MVAIKDFEMPHSCGGCMLRESSRLGRGEILHICSASGENGKRRKNAKKEHLNTMSGAKQKIINI